MESKEKEKSAKKEMSLTRAVCLVSRECFFLFFGAYSEPHTESGVRKPSAG
jgi:hypothetical protein